MKQLFIFLILFSNLFAQAQTPEENLDKYWKYRDRLRKDFLKIGNLPGESIPMSARSIGFAYSGVPANANGDKPSRIYYQDANIYLGHYLAVLATELKLLLNSYNATEDYTEQQALLEQLEATKKELYYALQTVNRLDLNAEEYLSEGVNSESPDDLNGLLMRDDVPENFHDKFVNDYSEIFQRECDFTMTHSDTKPVEVWGNATYAAGEQVPYNAGNVMSLDQVTSIFMGLKTVHTLVPSMVVQPTPTDHPLNLKEEAKNMIFRMIGHVINDVDGCTNNCKSFNIRTWDGLFRPAGYDLTFAAPFIVKIGLELGHPVLTQMQQDDELQNMRVAFQMHPQEPQSREFSAA